MRSFTNIQSIFSHALVWLALFGACSAVNAEIVAVEESVAKTASASPSAAKPFRVTALGAFDEEDTRHLYEVAVIRMILEKTSKEFGPYELTEARGMTHNRSLEMMTHNLDYPNFVRSYGYTPEMVSQDHLTLIPFPLWRGLLGYRTCFTSERIANVFEHAETLEELREFSHGQGTGWIDAEILRYNKFEVKEIPAYTSLFKMVAKNRFDLFCRGANEVREEFGRFSYIHGLVYDRSKVFYYPFPHFLFTHSSNKKLVERLEAGIEIIIKDGSFEKFWSEYHKNNLRFINFSKRQYIKLENPFMKDFDVPYEHLIYQLNSPSPLP